jgi:hypothetical protein
VIELDGLEVRSEDYELAAFVGNECRGSVKLMYVEPLDRYVAFLLVYGNAGDRQLFVMTDGSEEIWSSDCLEFAADGTAGTLTEPAVLHFRTTGLGDVTQKPVNVYPNPSDGIFNIEGEDILKIEVVDMYGQVILSEDVKTVHIRIDLGDKAAGAYLLRVVTDGGIVTHKIVKNVR